MSSMKELRIENSDRHILRRHHWQNRMTDSSDICWSSKDRKVAVDEIVVVNNPRSVEQGIVVVQEDSTLSDIKCWLMS